ncbi:SAM-dependent methyltransferase [Nocardia sp. NPDC052254]|uniref:SAM-dependent methyltransferase n=1 Tax=Nocardia sp. NPDC052254 TaxID=3155681 RepID=UPI003431DFF6
MNDDAMRARQTRPSVARVYDYILGGRDNYGVDQNLADYFIDFLPGSEQVAITARAATLRAVRSMCAKGIRQYIDLGCGLPASENVHEVVRREYPDAPIIYVDNDPFVVAHGKALMQIDDRIAVVNGNLCSVDEIAAHPDVRRLINFDEPVGLLFGIVLAFVEDGEDPVGVVGSWSDRVSAGSQIYVSHFRSGHNRETSTTERKILDAFGRGRWRNDDEVRALFGDLELIEPGLRPCAQWWPDVRADDSGRELSLWEQLIVSGLARKAG